MKRTVGMVSVLIALATYTTTAVALDSLKIASGGRGNWDSAPAELGQKAGIFKKHGIELDILYSAGSGETLQTVIAGAADVGVALGTGSVMAAYLKGAPLRAIGSVTTGANDIYWYVRKESPLKSLKDATPQTTIAYSSSGSSTYVLAQEIVNLNRIEAKPTRTGSPQATFTQVMSGQIDVGYATAPFALQQVAEGQIRIIARGGEVPGTDEQTVRLLIVNAQKLATSRDIIRRFMQAYAETVDWMYSDPKAIDLYSAFSGVPASIAMKGMAEFYTKKTLDPYRISGLDKVMADSIKMKLLQSALTKEQIAELFQVPKPN